MFSARSSHQRSGSFSRPPVFSQRKLDQRHCSGDFTHRPFAGTGLWWQYSAFSIAFFIDQIFKIVPVPKLPIAIFDNSVTSDPFQLFQSRDVVADGLAIDERSVL